MHKKGFDNELYIKLQSENINKRIKQFDNKLYLEFGGKLFDDYHASRVLPGFEPDTKVKMLLNLKEKVEIIIVINSSDIEKNKIRGDLGITYDQDVLRLIDAFRSIDLFVGSVVVAQYENQLVVDTFKSKLEKLGIKVYLHYPIENYPNDIPFIVSEDGYGKNDYVETSKELIVVTAPGPGSGKMATCLSQLYHDYKRGIKAGYAKFETFPIWNIPLKHPVNVAYEAATADLADINMIDPFHLEKYDEKAINYNRDVEVFPLLKTLIKNIANKDIYYSPTDMGVNMAGFCIADDKACSDASKDEIVRRYYDALVSYRKGNIDKIVIEKLELLMNQMEIDKNFRKVAQIADDKAVTNEKPVVAIQLNNNKIITGRTTSLLGASSSCLLNALKELAGIHDDVLLIPPEIISPIIDLKTNIIGNNNPRLHLDETLIALSVASLKNKDAELALKELKNIAGSEAHSSVILSEVDVKVFKSLGINLTQQATYYSKKLYHKK